MTGAPTCVIESRCVSSSSITCDDRPFMNAAFAHEVRYGNPMTVHSRVPAEGSDHLRRHPHLLGVAGAERGAEQVEHEDLGGLDDVRRQVLESKAGEVARELASGANRLVAASTYPSSSLRREGHASDRRGHRALGLPRLIAPIRPYRTFPEQALFARETPGFITSSDVRHRRASTGPGNWFGLPGRGRSSRLHSQSFHCHRRERLRSFVTIETRRPPRCPRIMHEAKAEDAALAQSEEDHGGRSQGALGPRQESGAKAGELVAAQSRPRQRPVRGMLPLAVR